MFELKDHDMLQVIWKKSSIPLNENVPLVSKEDALIQQVSHSLSRLFPILRSITGPGVRKTLDIISELVPLAIAEVPSGTPVFDWVIPPEWRCREAYAVGPSGERVVDMEEHYLHILNYSESFSGRVSKDEFLKHVLSYPKQPHLIPYHTSYYSRKWGFSMAHEKVETLQDGDYEVHIDADLDPSGSLTLGELFLEGRTKDEILFTCYACHPQMGNDSLSGVIAAVFLYRLLQQQPIENRRFSYRFVFLPETIGAICYLSIRGAHLKKHLIAGYVLTCIGDRGYFSYKKSRHGATVADFAGELAMKNWRGRSNPFGAHQGIVYDFWPSGSDERQFCSPGFDLPVGGFCRTFYGIFHEYHTSDDSLEFISPKMIAESSLFLLSLCEVLEYNHAEFAAKALASNISQTTSETLASENLVTSHAMDVYYSLLPFGEPQLGRRNMYHAVGSSMYVPSTRIDAIMWLMGYADGKHTLQQISDQSFIHLQQFASNIPNEGFRFSAISVHDLHAVAQELVAANMLAKVE
jgi:aminopeptidase-like protein